MKLQLLNKKGKLDICSEEIKEILKSRPDFVGVEDISTSISQKDIMVFDCKLSDEVFDMEDIEELLEESGEEIDESYFEVFFEDVRAYIKDATDEIESEIQETYLMDNVRCFFDVYNVNEEFTDFKFVFLVAFKDIKISNLTNLSKIVGRKQLVGASKFYS